MLKKPRSSGGPKRLGPAKRFFPDYPAEEYLNGLKHLVLSKKNPSPELIEKVTNAVFKQIEGECHRIRTKADARAYNAKADLDTVVTKLNTLDLERKMKEQ